MLGLWSVEQAIWVCSCVATLVLLLRLWGTGLYRFYRFFCGYLLVEVLRSAVMFQLDPNTNAYALTYMASEPVVWLFYVLVVLELYGLVLRHHPGIESLGRWALACGLLLAVAASGATLYADIGNPAEKYPILLLFSVFQRGVVSALVVFLLLIFGFLAWYPVSVNRNTVVYCATYVVYFLSKSLTLLTRNILGHDLTRALSTATLAVSTACLLIWIVFLTRDGETRTVIVGHTWHPEESERLVEKLNALNASLVRSSRK